MTKTKQTVNLTISPNLYDMYKDNYNFSKILDEILTDFVIHDSTANYTPEQMGDKIYMKTKNGKIYNVDAVSYFSFISFLMDLSKK